MNHTITITCNKRITAESYIRLLRATSLGERRPTDDVARMAAMLHHSNLLATAWAGETLVGAARCVTDFAYCCYVSDLAVDERYQKNGIGKQLLRAVQKELHPAAKLILLAAPASVDYYPHIGFTAHTSAWVIGASGEIG